MFSARYCLPRHASIAGLAAFVFWPTLATGQIGMKVHDIGFGISLSLPSSWTADTQSQLGQLRERSLDAMGSSTLQALRDIASDNSNALLFRASDGADPHNSISLNVTVGPETNLHSFDAAGPRQLAAIVDELCGLFADQAFEAGGEGHCTGHEVRTLQGRGTLILRQTVTIPALALDNRRVVALIPGDGLLLTLGLSVGVDQYDAGVVSAVLASVRIPPQ